MTIGTQITIWLVGGFSLIIFAYGIYTLSVSKESIFKGSGDAPKMGLIVLYACNLMTKYFFGILIISIIFIFICEKIIGIDQGLPIITLIIGYLLAKGFESPFELKKEIPGRTGQ